MNDHEIEVAKALAAHPQWGWREGMKYVYGDQFGIWGRVDAHKIYPAIGAIPDLSDPATVGALIADLAQDSQICIRMEKTERSSFYQIEYFIDGRGLYANSDTSRSYGAPAGNAWLALAKWKEGLSHAICFPTKAGRILTLCGTWVGWLNSDAPIMKDPKDASCPRCKMGGANAD